MFIPVLSVSTATPMAHLTSPCPSWPFKISFDKKWINPWAKASIRMAFINTSSRAPRLRVVGKEASTTGMVVCVAMNNWVKRSLKKPVVRGLRSVKSIGSIWNLLSQIKTVAQQQHTFKIERVQQSLAIHHPYAFAIFANRVPETFLTSKPSFSLRFLMTAAPPTVISPRSRRKSQR